MKQGQRLNWKFSIADTDHIRHLCTNARMTDRQIVGWFKRLQYRDITVEEVRRICKEVGQRVKIDSRSTQSCS